MQGMEKWDMGEDGANGFVRTLGYTYSRLDWLG